jgi:2-(1,2-epoxy-1,2-dihydrophenyl)acetyl-CoA isomerase
MALAQRLANGPTVALGELRRLLHGSFQRDLQTQLEAESTAFVHCADSADFKSGVDAFFARRPPAFNGH